MHEEEVELLLVDIEPVLPDVAVLPVGVALQLEVIGVDAEERRVAVLEESQRRGPRRPQAGHVS